MLGLIFLFDELSGLQIILFQVSNLLYLAYIISYKPQFEQQKLEIFNESCTLLLTCLLPCFTHFLPNAGLQYHIAGYAFISIFCLNLLLNLSLVLYLTLRSSLLQLRYYFIWTFHKIKVFFRKIFMVHKAEIFSNIIKNSEGK